MPLQPATNAAHRVHPLRGLALQALHPARQLQQRRGQARQRSWPMVVGATQRKERYIVQRGSFAFAIALLVVFCPLPRASLRSALRSSSCDATTLLSASSCGKAVRAQGACVSPASELQRCLGSDAPAVGVTHWGW